MKKKLDLSFVGQTRIYYHQPFVTFNSFILKTYQGKLDIMVLSCNRRTWEVVARGSVVQGHPPSET